MAQPIILSRSFKDLAFSFGKHPKTSDVLIKTNEQAIKAAVKHLILTYPGERPFQPELGTGIRRMLFENLDYCTAARISQEISRTIKKYEKRVILNRVRVDPDPDNNRFDVSIEFEIIGQPNPQEIEFYLESTR